MYCGPSILYYGLPIFSTGCRFSTILSALYYGLPNIYCTRTVIDYKPLLLYHGTLCSVLRAVDSLLLTVDSSLHTTGCSLLTRDSLLRAFDVEELMCEFVCKFVCEFVCGFWCEFWCEF